MKLLHIIPTIVQIREQAILYYQGKIQTYIAAKGFIIYANIVSKTSYLKNISREANVKLIIIEKLLNITKEDAESH